MDLAESTWQLFFLILRRVLGDRIIICHGNGVTQKIFPYKQYWLSHNVFIGEVYFKINGRPGPAISVAVGKNISLFISQHRFQFWLVNEMLPKQVNEILLQISSATHEECIIRWLKWSLFFHYFRSTNGCASGHYQMNMAWMNIITEMKFILSLWN